MKVSSLRVGELADALTKATTDRVMKEKAARVGERIREVRITTIFNVSVYESWRESLTGSISCFAGGRGAERHSCNLHISTTSSERSPVPGLMPLPSSLFPCFPSHLYPFHCLPSLYLILMTLTIRHDSFHYPFSLTIRPCYSLNIHPARSYILIQVSP